MRRVGKKKTKDVSQFFLIALEDEKSSRYYFQQLIKEKGLNAAVTCVPHCGTSPKNVLSGIPIYLKSNPECKLSKAWIVIDRDSFPIDNFKGTIESARQQNICVAYSNESYELWILLHFKDVYGHKGRDEINKELDVCFKDKYNMDYSKNCNDIYTILKPMQHDAIKRAKKLLIHWIKIGGKLDPANNNPSTTIHFLVNCLNNFDKCKKLNYPCNFSNLK